MSVPRFDFSLNLDLIGELNSQETGPKSAKDKDAKRLARCGKCNNCKSQDCGTCYNCADKPKFGGPGVKKQACINRKCLLMVPRDEEGEKIARKRAKQRTGESTKGAAVDPRAGGMGKPYVLPAGLGAQPANTGPISPPSSPGTDWSTESLDGEQRNSPLTTSDATGFSYPSHAFQSGPTSARLDPAEPTTGLTQARTGLTPYFSAGTTTAADELPALFGDSVSFMLPPARSEFPSIFLNVDFGAEKINACPPKDAPRDWSWTNPLLLQEEFILMNDNHRRASAQPSSNCTVVAF